MAGLGTKIFIFTLLLSFGFSMIAQTKVGSVGAGSTTYDESAANKSQEMFDYTNNFFTAGLAAGVSLVATLVSGNPIYFFAGVAASLITFNTLATASINESFGNEVGTMLKTLITFLYAVAIVSWFGSRNEP
jgi:hypothetical protein